MLGKEIPIGDDPVSSSIINSRGGQLAADERAREALDKKDDMNEEYGTGVNFDNLSFMQTSAAESTPEGTDVGKDISIKTSDVSTQKEEKQGLLSKIFGKSKKETRKTCRKIKCNF